MHAADLRGLFLLGRSFAQRSRVGAFLVRYMLLLHPRCASPAVSVGEGV